MIVDRLDLDALPRGARSDRWVTLAEDALGEPIAVPVSVIRGAREGPVLGITAALHGDELNGLAALQRLLAGVDPSALRGSLVGVLVANLPGFQAGIRRYVDGNDLNHIMPGDPRGKEAERYAHALVTRLVEDFDAFVDLHTASVGRVNSLYVRADLDHAPSARLARVQDADILLHAPTSETSLRGTAMARGMPAVTLELGDPGVWQPEVIQRAARGLRATLRSLEMLPMGAEDAGTGDEQGDADMAEAQGGAGPDARHEAVGARSDRSMIVCARSSWLRTERGGLIEVLPQLCERVEEGQEIARRYDVFGHVLERLHAPETGIVIGRAVSPLAPGGARYLHLGVEAGPADRFAGMESGFDAASGIERDAEARGDESNAGQGPHDDA